MVNEDDIERVISAYTKKTIVKHIRLNPGTTVKEIQRAAYGPNEWNWPSARVVNVHICQVNRTLRIHQYEIRNLSRYRASYRLVSLKGP